MHNFPARLEEALKRAGLSKGALAQGTNVALSTVSRWFGGAVPKWETVYQIGNLLGVDANWLLTGEGSPDPAERRAPAVIHESEEGLFRAKVQEDEIPYRVNYGDALKKPLKPDPLAAWYVRSMEKGEAMTLARSFLDEYEAGDQTALARAVTLLQILADSPRT